MDFFDAITTRAVVKKFDKTPVNDKLIGAILYMANNAESAGDMQEWQFIVVKDEEIKKQLYNASLKLDVVKDAPVDIVVCADLKKISMKFHERGEYLYSVQDTASVITIMFLTAKILGLGANWIRAFDEAKVKEILGLPADIRPVGIVTLGYPSEKSEKKKLDPFEHLTWVDKYHQKYNISAMLQPGPAEEVFKPIINQIIDKLKKK